MIWHTHDMFQRLLAIFIFILCIPLFVFLFIIIFIWLRQPFIFSQKRIGKNKKPFTIYKIQTMISNAEALKEKYSHLNEADGPVFKIKNDPRYTKIGKLLSKTGLDELPQLINIIKGEMAFVGPRPLPVEEANKILSTYHKRFSVLPGITSLWVINGSHKLSFKRWMELDLFYVKNRSILLDISIAIKTVSLIFQSFFRLFKKY